MIWRHESDSVALANSLLQRDAFLILPAGTTISIRYGTKKSWVGIVEKRVHNTVYLGVRLQSGFVVNVKPQNLKVLELSVDCPDVAQWGRIDPTIESM